MDDMRAVMDDAGIAKSVVYGISEGGSLALLFAATYPDRVTALALFGAFACREKKPDYPWAPSPSERQLFYDAIQSGWAGEMDLSNVAPTLIGDEERMARWCRYLRSSASPSGALQLAKLNTAIDVRHVLPAVRARTVVMHRQGDRDVKLAEARYLAARLPNAELRELPGEDHLPTVGDTQPILSALKELAGVADSGSVDRRMLATLLFTDIVGSTDHLRQLGDADWTKLMTMHNESAQRLVRQHRGHVVKFTGDGLLAYFDGPARAARCALQLAKEVKEMGLDNRAAVHTCEVELAADDLMGLGVHLAARAMAVAGPGEVLATGTTKALVSGSGLQFEHAGSHSFRGFDELVDVYVVS
jgi:class 3 adenylate cyclase